MRFSKVQLFISFCIFRLGMLGKARDGVDFGGYRIAGRRAAAGSGLYHRRSGVECGRRGCAEPKKMHNEAPLEMVYRCLKTCCLCCPFCGFEGRPNKLRKALRRKYLGDFFRVPHCSLETVFHAFLTLLAEHGCYYYSNSNQLRLKKVYK